MLYRSAIALFGNYYYWTIVIAVPIGDLPVWQLLLLDNSYCCTDRRSPCLAIITIGQ
ncbi:MAG: hypothetical protein SWX82_14615 [Cyanobacteriota bacterium]|nr:hypothetical protein [Cyanobacteriota bacterium]